MILHRPIKSSATKVKRNLKYNGDVKRSNIIKEVNYSNHSFARWTTESVDFYAKDVFHVGFNWGNESVLKKEGKGTELHFL